MRRFLLLLSLTTVAVLGLGAPAAQAASSPVEHRSVTTTNDCNGTPVLLHQRTIRTQQTNADGSTTFVVHGRVTATNTVTGQQLTLPESYSVTYFVGGGGKVTGRAYLDLASLFTFRTLYYYVGDVSVGLSAGGYSLGGTGDRTSEVCGMLGAPAQP